MGLRLLVLMQSTMDAHIITHHRKLSGKEDKSQMIRIGVMGSSIGPFDREVLEACRRLGAGIAKRGCCLLTGACPGLPHEVVLGAKSFWWSHDRHLTGSE